MKNIIYVSLGITIFVVLVSIAGAPPFKSNAIMVPAVVAGIDNISSGDLEQNQDAPQSTPVLDEVNSTYYSDQIDSEGRPIPIDVTGWEQSNQVDQWGRPIFIDEDGQKRYSNQIPTGPNVTSGITQFENGDGSLVVARGNVAGKFVVGPYDISFNFDGMNEYKFSYVDPFSYVEPSVYESYPNIIAKQREYGWIDGEIKLDLEKREGSKDSKITFLISRSFSKPQANDVSDQTIASAMQSKYPELAKSYLEMRDPCRGYDNCGYITNQNITWFSYQNKQDVERPIPKDNYYYKAKISPNESLELSFENVPKSIVDQFMKSLSITGFGVSPTKESWDDYVERVRRPSPDDPGITPMEFIDKMYGNYEYDANSGFFIKKGARNTVLPNKPIVMVDPLGYKFNSDSVEAEAIRYHYYGPIPLPKNVSLNTPNGTPL